MRSAAYATRSLFGTGTATTGVTDTATQSRLLAQIEDAAVGDRVEEALKLCVKIDPNSPGAYLRNWALRELRGYEHDEELPEYRLIAGALMADWTDGVNFVRGQELSPFVLPEVVREHVPPAIEMRHAVSDLVEMATNDSVRLQPVSLQLAKELLSAQNEHGQHVVSLYFHVTAGPLKSMCSRICTDLLDIVATLRADAAGSDEIVSAERSVKSSDAAALNIHGGNNTITSVVQGAHGAAEVTASRGVQSSVKTGGIRQRSKAAIGARIVRITLVLSVCVALTLVLWQVT